MVKLFCHSNQATTKIFLTVNDRRTIQQVVNYVQATYIETNVTVHDIPYTQKFFGIKISCYWVVIVFHINY